jgi:hypothetical protein
MNGETRLCLEDAASDSNVADFDQKDSSEIDKGKKGHNYRGKKNCTS